ncbi:PREDICTED: WD repeat-containing protein 35 [Nicrophorus vespilloides]|uniref:WD repeat-containing protein 35 n=1 Tax=Nicrophorus vespilloides TaxID=110193 RepID=A0ABM1N7F9_NICVS|nr:PREDICTED: WD repeat-containing protein 35 [Nicrophorus vespilloides]
MFIYLSKKIAIPNNTKLHCIAWNAEDGYIAVGGEDGLLKVLKLDSGNEAGAGPNLRGLAASSNLSMNQTLEGHTENIKVITWNETHKKLTTSDQNGVIIVWMLYKGAWYEEMINNRKKSTVVGMCWSYDGLKICIIYEDGAVIVGSVDGNRIWGKELKGVHLSSVQWSPDGKLLLFSLHNGQVHLYDNQGNFVMRLEVQCLESTDIVAVVGLDWYNGKHGYIHALCPCLAICYENGRMQLMYNESDPSPVILDTGMNAVYCSWNHNGTLIAVTGRQIEADKESNVVQFYSPYGDHLRTLKVPGHSISCCVWEGGSLRVALAVDSFVYFANIRPNYKWCYFKKTVVYTSCRPQKPGVCITFWDITNNQCHSRYVPVLIGIAAFGDHCVLVTKSDTDNELKEQQYGLLLCNTLGTPVDGKYIDIEPQFVAINSTHVFAASKNNFLVWQYKTPKSYSLLTHRMKCRLYHIDDNPSGAVEVIQDLEQNVELPVSLQPSNDPICCIAASDRALVIGRESGNLQHYALPHCALCNRYKIGSRPHKMAINCNSTRISIIDVSGIMTVLDLTENITRSNPDLNKMERKDVWAMCWASDNPQSLAIMEKTRMYIFKGVNPEEPISSSGYICSFQDLEIEAVLLDEVMENPEKMNSDHILKLEVKSLRDTRQLLEKVGINEAAEFIEDNPHPRLWRLLAEAALKEVNLTVAESAFIRSLDYCGILFVKRLHGINNETIRKACIATYFKEFDKAEKFYIESDRRDLALILRQTLGDWFRVIQIMKNGVSAPDLVLNVAYNSTADYFAHFNNWTAAVEYYELAKNRHEMIECYYHLEDYKALQEMIDSLPEGDSLLQNIADLFASDAVYSVAIKALIKLGNIKAAVDLCILHNKWDQAIELATKYDLPQINVLFKKYTLHLVEQNMLTNAVEINMQAKHFSDASELALKFAVQESKRPMKKLISVKKLFVYAALLTESSVSTDVNLDLQDNIWKGAEAYHYLILAQENLYANKFKEAMNIAFKLQEYTNYINETEVYTLLALIASQHEAYGVCSTAFIKLKSLPLTEGELAECQRLCFDIFSLHKPCDDHLKKRKCPHCNNALFDWSTICGECNSTFTNCIVSGEPILNRHQSQWICRTCHHVALEKYISFRKFCPLCHSAI